MANRWVNNGNSERIYLGGSNITWDGDCSHKIKRRLLLGRKSMTNLESVLKSRHITTKVRLVKAMVFPVVMYGCESWTIKKAECRRIDTFELWCWRRLLRILWTTRRLIKSVNPKGNQPWILFGKTDAEPEAPILWPPDAKSRFIGKDWCWEWLKAKGEKGGRGWDD